MLEDIPSHSEVELSGAVCTDLVNGNDMASSRDITVNPVDRCCPQFHGAMERWGDGAMELWFAKKFGRKMQVKHIYVTRAVGLVEP